MFSSLWKNISLSNEHFFIVDEYDLIPDECNSIQMCIIPNQVK